MGCGLSLVSAWRRPIGSKWEEAITSRALWIAAGSYTANSPTPSTSSDHSGDAGKAATPTMPAPSAYQAIVFQGARVASRDGAQRELARQHQQHAAEQEPEGGAPRLGVAELVVEAGASTSASGALKRIRPNTIWARPSANTVQAAALVMGISFGSAVAKSLATLGSRQAARLSNVQSGPVCCRICRRIRDSDTSVIPGSWPGAPAARGRPVQAADGTGADSARGRSGPAACPLPLLVQQARQHHGAQRLPQRLRVERGAQVRPGRRHTLAGSSADTTKLEGCSCIAGVSRMSMVPYPEALGVVLPSGSTLCTRSRPLSTK